MKTLFRVSDAASLGIHSMLLLAVSNGHSVSAKDLAAEMHASEAHVAKVLQRLAKEGLVTSTRGPRGGFRLGRPVESVTLLDVYRAIEGPVPEMGCLLNEPICEGECCIFGKYLQNISEGLVEHMSRTTIQQVCKGVRLRHGDSTENR